MFKSILVPLDGTPVAEAAIEVAIGTAAVSRASIDLVLVHDPVSVGAMEVAPWNEDRWATQCEYLNGVSERTALRTLSLVTHAILRGDPATMICKRATEVHADLIIMESRTRTGVARALLGSVADQVLRRTAVSVLMLRSSKRARTQATGSPAFERILVAQDGSPESLEVLQPVSDFAHSHNAEIVILRIVEPVPLPVADVGPFFPHSPSAVDLDATAQLQDEAERQNARVRVCLERLGNSRIETHVLTEPSVGHAISEFARTNGIDAIAMSVHGRGASRIIVGAIADALLRRTSLPILFRNCRAESSEDFCLTEEELVEQLPSLPDL